MPKSHPVPGPLPECLYPRGDVGRALEAIKRCGGERNDINVFFSFLYFSCFFKAETLNDLKFGSKIAKVVAEPQLSPAKTFHNCHCSLVFFSEVKQWKEKDGGGGGGRHVLKTSPKPIF